MAEKLTDTLVRKLAAPATGQIIVWDSEIRGFGIRVTAKGAKAYVLNYRTLSGRERRITLATQPGSKDATEKARREAAGLRGDAKSGEDPLEERKKLREAPNVAKLCERYKEEHLPKKREASIADDESMIRDYILKEARPDRPKPEGVKLGPMKVADVDSEHIEKLHAEIVRAGKPYRANRVVALLSKMFSLAAKWKMRPLHSNPCEGVGRAEENARERYLSEVEVSRLHDALDAHRDQQAADIIRLLLLTGARKGEVLSMRWGALDLAAGRWLKPAATTKQKKDHHAPLSPHACVLLAEIRAKIEDEDEPFVFPGRGRGGHRNSVKKDWRAICIAAGLVDTATTTDARGQKKTVVTPNVRIHDLRHTFASALVSTGHSLPVIGKLLGHTQAKTTERYTHLYDDVQRQAAERAGSILTPKRGPSAEIVPLKGGAA